MMMSTSITIAITSTLKQLATSALPPPGQQKNSYHKKDILTTITTSNQKRRSTGLATRMTFRACVLATIYTVNRTASAHAIDAQRECLLRAAGAAGSRAISFRVISTASIFLNFG